MCLKTASLALEAVVELEFFIGEALESAKLAVAACDLTSTAVSDDEVPLGCPWDGHASM